jgi:multidrug transporter EmrE-like cation transporter
MTLFLIFLVLIVIATEVGREICFKMGSNSKIKGYFLIKIFLEPIIWFGFFLWTIEVITLIFLLQQAPLNIVYPMTSLAYCGTTIAAKFLLKERINFIQWIGTIFVTLGVAIIGSVATS